MPELPEVETIKKGLEKTIIGKNINDIKILKAKSFSGNIKEVVGNTIKSVNRRAKVIIIEINSKVGQQKYLLIHLKMTGQLIYRIKNYELRIKNKDTKISPYDI